MALENYVLLERIELNNTASSVTFSNIPQTGYTDLKLIASARSASATGDSSQTFSLSFNGLTTNRSQRQIYAYGTTVASDSSASNIIGSVMNGTTGTANTFTNCEFYIPNFTSNTAKSISLDKTNESNTASGNSLSIASALWNSIAAITSITLTADSNSFAANSTFSLYGLAAVGVAPTNAPKASGGNVIATDGTYWYHAFLSNGTFTPQTALSADVLVVGGGGSGGGQVGGGGGAGGYRLLTGQSLAATNYTCVVGSGGAGVNGSANTGNNGIASSIGSISASGGGGGGPNASSPVALNGGSGGGAGESANYGLGNSGGYSPIEGYRGGSASDSSYYGSGGGGGAGAIGGDGSTGAGGNGGAGSNSASTWASVTGTGVSGYYAGGGGGSILNPGTKGSGGAGGGGAAAQLGGAETSTAGTVNTGSGGGGQGSNSASFLSGAGGSGIIIVRYAVA